MAAELSGPQSVPRRNRGALLADSALRRFDNVRDLIANPFNPSPLVRLNRVRPGDECQLYLKLEWFNSFGGA